MSINKSFAFLLLAGLCLCAYAANLSDLEKKKLLLSQGDLMGSSGSSFNMGSSVVETFEDLTGGINPDRYYIGNGDAFFVAVVDLPSVKYDATVNQQGNVYIPELGVIKLGRVTLTQAQKAIGDFVQGKLKKSNEVYVTLTTAKKAAVSVNGIVSDPGTLVLSGAFRILDAIRAANKNEIPSLNECNLREVRVTNGDSSYTVDLFGYLLKNNPVDNPYIFPGDNIMISLSTRRAILNAPIRSKVGGWVPIKQNESLADFLSFFVFDPSADTTTITVQSTTVDNQRRTMTLSWGQASTLSLQDRDIITIPPKKNYSPILMVQVSGEVAQPGSYPIERETSTVDELLAMAGGATRYANTDRTVVVRRSKIADSKVRDFGVTDQAIQQSATIRPEIVSALSKMSALNDYSVIETHGSSAPVKLQNEDKIVVPRKEFQIFISGNVRQPGAYAYEPGKSARYYIREAGGFGLRADRMNCFVLRYFNGVSQMKDFRDPIKEGDIIIVPDSQQSKMLSTIILPILSATLGVLSTALGLYSVLNR